MDPIHETTAPNAYGQPRTGPTFGDRVRRSKALIPALAVLGATSVALAAALVVKNADHNPAYPDGSLQGSTQGYTQSTPLSDRANSVGIGSAPSAVALTTPQPQNYAPGSYQQQAYQQPAYQQAPQGQLASPVAQAPVCQTCGTVESVTPVRHAGQGSGVGAVAGGLVGGLLGNQIGGGSGRTLATVAGAVGGGYAGNYIEKNHKSYTTYQMRVRMQDGSTRTVTQGTAVAAGSPVRVEGNRLRVVAG